MSNPITVDEVVRLRERLRAAESDAAQWQADWRSLSEQHRAEVAAHRETQMALEATEMRLEDVLDRLEATEAGLAALVAGARAVVETFITQNSSGLTFCWACDRYLDHGGHADDCPASALAALLDGDA